MNLGVVSTEYRGNTIRYKPNENVWAIDGDEGRYSERTFNSLKSAASFIDRKMAALKRIAPFPCIILREKTLRGSDFEKWRVTSVVDETTVWVTDDNTRKKLDVSSRFVLLVDSEKNINIIKEIQHLEKRIQTLEAECKERLKTLEPINLRAIISARREEVSEAEMKIEEDNNAD